jgi:DNA polymerase/3'-5' exonuclease PolX
LKTAEGIGKKIYDKIVEILATGGLAAAERMKERSDVGAMDALLGVHGIGPVKAKELMRAGITSIASLRAAVSADPDLLNDTQKIGLTY